jgi:hypothetical protein
MDWQKRSSARSWFLVRIARWLRTERISVQLTPQSVTPATVLPKGNHFKAPTPPRIGALSLMKLSALKWRGISSEVVRFRKPRTKP